MELCLFRIDHQEYALPMSNVREVLNRPRVSPVPLSPDILSGIIHFRGQIVPVFAIDHLFENFNSSPTLEERSRILILTQEHQTLGIQVDQVDEISLPDELGTFFTDNPPFLLGMALTHAGRSFKPTSLPRLVQSLSHTLSNVTLNLLD